MVVPRLYGPTDGCTYGSRVSPMVVPRLYLGTLNPGFDPRSEVGCLESEVHRDASRCNT